MPSKLAHRQYATQEQTRAPQSDAARCWPHCDSALLGVPLRTRPLPLVNGYASRQPSASLTRSSPPNVLGTRKLAPVRAVAITTHSSSVQSFPLHMNTAMHLSWPPFALAKNGKNFRLAATVWRQGTRGIFANPPADSTRTVSKWSSKRSQTRRTSLCSRVTDNMSLKMWDPAW